MSENTSQGRLDVLLPAWEAQLQLWARNGSLVAAAQDALVLNGTPDALQALIDQWSAGDFSGLPPIVLLSASDISGAMGAYAISTGTIYLNQDWLLGASADQANAVLTEELGHHLDGLLNAVDTPGDEGEYFSRLLSGLAPSQGEKDLLRSQSDSGIILTQGNMLPAEQAAGATLQTITFDDASILIADGYCGLKWGGYWNTTVIGGYYSITNYTGDKQAWAYKGLATATAATQDFTWNTAVFDNAYASDTPLVITSYDDGIQVGRLEIVIPGYNSPGYVFVDFGAKAASVRAPGSTGGQVSYSQQSVFAGRFTSIDKLVFEWPTPGNLYENSFVTDDWVLSFEGANDAGQGTASAITSQGAVAFNESVTLLAGAVTGDPDGAATITAYQWLLNGNAISGATRSTYTTTATGFGSYSVQETYTDAKGFIATVTSGSKSVAKIDNGQGSLAAISGNGAFQEGVTLSAGAITGDPDGAATPTAYQWYLNGSAISGATSAAYAVNSTAYGTYKVAVTYSDAQGFSSTLTSADQLVAKIDNGQGSLAAISGNGTFQEGVTLSAGGITGDPDGAATPTAYQWYLNGSAISGATSAAYAVGATGTGTYKVAVTYADAQGFSATLTSADQLVAKIDNGQGSLAAITGNGAFQEGVTLSAGAISGDPDGAATPTAYQWYLNGSAISGATSAAYAVNSTAYGTYKVAVTYSDAQGFSSTLTSADQLVAKIDNGQGSLAAISGNGAFQEGVTLSAGGITGDPDGAATPTAYQWYLNGSAISGATSAAYAVGATGTGTYKVAVTYADAQGFSATLTSADQLVAKIDNGQGSLAAITGNGAFQEGVTLSAGAISGDPDGAATPTAYQWYLNGSAISGATASTYAVGATGTGTYKVAVTYADAQGFSATLTSADQTIAKVDNGQGSLAAISGNGAFQEGVTLSAGAITGDPDGAATPTAYQWYLNGSAISGATSAAYAVNSTAYGTYKVAVTYADAQGFSATLTSADQSVAKVDNGQGSVAITGTTTVGSVLSATAVSGDPEGLASAPAYSYTWLRNGLVISGAISSNYTLASADLGSQISVRVGYTDGQGYAASTTSAPTVPISSPPDTVSPTVTAMAVQGSTISLTFSEPITGTSLTATNYVVAVAATPRTISAISLDATTTNKLLLTLSGTAPTATQSLTVAYALPAGNPSSGIVTDLAGNPLQSFTTRPVDTFVSISAIGSNNSPLQADYINATLSGSSGVNVYGNAQNNTINGNDANNALYGAAGNDSIKGNGGNDSLHGGAGVDSLTGGLGSDTFFFDSKPATFSTSTVDHVTDFNTNQSDKISFGKSAYGFTSTSVSLLTISSNTQLTSALATSNVFIYDGSQGLLYWNQNGATSGAGTGGIVAVLDAQAGIYPLLAASNLAIA